MPLFLIFTIKKAFFIWMLVSWLSLFLTVLKFSLQNKTFVLIKNSVNSSLTLFITFSLLYSWGIISSHCNGWNWNWQSKLCHFTIQSFARWTNCLWQHAYDACLLDNTGGARQQHSDPSVCHLSPGVWTMRNNHISQSLTLFCYFQNICK